MDDFIQIEILQPDPVPVPVSGLVPKDIPNAEELRKAILKGNYMTSGIHARIAVKLEREERGSAKVAFRELTDPSHQFVQRKDCLQLAAFFTVLATMLPD